MKTIELTAFSLAQRFVGMKEVAGLLDNPQIMAMLRLDAPWSAHDEVPWCSAFVNYICWLLRLPRSKSLAARSWLSIGEAVGLYDAEAGFDVVILKREGANEPGPEVLNAQGHVGFFAGAEDNQKLAVYSISSLQILGGNQGNAVSVSWFPIEQVLGIRRIY